MQYYIGLDVSLKETSVCIIDANGDITKEGKVFSDPDSITTFLGTLNLDIALIGLEAGQLSSWLFNGLSEAGYPAVCIESRHMSTALKVQHVKTDRNDARGIAHMMRTGWYKTVNVKSHENQKLRVLLVNRKWLVEKKIAISNQIRGTIRTFGCKLGHVSEGDFASRVHALLQDEPELYGFIAPMLRIRDEIRRELVALDKIVVDLVKEHEVCKRLVTVPGIGPINALAFVTAIDNPHNFRKSRSVGAFFGLTPRKFASGEIDRNGSITKCGDDMVRVYLYEAAKCLLGRTKKPSALKAWAMRLSKRSSARNAVVALARKLSVIMHRIWVDGTIYQPA